MVVRILQGPLRGRKWIAGSSNHGCWLGTYELATQTAFRRAIKRGDVIYDVGANVGFYTLLASICTGPGGRVYSYEPLQRNIAELRKHVTINRLTNCEIIEAAISDRDGTARFDASRPRSMGQIAERGNETVPVVRIDSLVFERVVLPPNVLKIDVEGEELKVLQGAVETLSRHRPIIFLATHGPEARHGCICFLRESNYEIRSTNSLAVDRSDELMAFGTEPAPRGLE